MTSIPAETSIWQEFLPDRWRPNGLGPETRTNKTMLTSFAYGTSGFLSPLLDHVIRCLQVDMLALEGVWHIIRCD